MAVNTKKLVKCFRALVTFVENHKDFVIGFLLPFFVVFLVFALAGCTSNHYFSINAASAPKTDKDIIKKD